MPDVLALERAGYVQRHLLARRALLASRKAWTQLDPDRIRASWAATVGPRVLGVVVAAQYAAAQLAIASAPRMTAAQGLPDDPVAEVDPAAFAGTSSDGRGLGTLLELSNRVTLTAINTGLTPPVALAQGGRWLETVVGSQVLDAHRAAAAVATAARPGVAGYYRVLHPPSCSRCAVLAGRWYRWHADFNRHPRCDCGQVPAAEGALDDHPALWDAQSYFDSLTPAEQARQFTIDGAKAIREGADVAQVVNARRGMSSAVVGGRRAGVTTEGTTRRGQLTRVRLTPEEIWRIAGADRAEAVRLLASNGYFTGSVRAVTRRAG